MKFFININSGIIHSGENPCHSGKTMAEKNKKSFDTYQEAMNFYEGSARKGVPCGKCLKNFKEGE